MQVGLILSSSIAKKRFVRWYGLLFINNLADVETDERKRQFNVMGGLVTAIAGKAAEEIGSKKLGEGYKLLKNAEGYFGVLNISCLIRSKREDWLASASDIIARG